MGEINFVVVSTVISLEGSHGKTLKDALWIFHHYPDNCQNVSFKYC